MKNLLTFLALSVFLPTISFASTDQSFQQLINKSIQAGERLEMPDQTYMVLKMITKGNADNSDHHDYFSSVGFFSKNVFVASHVEVVSEVWTVNDKKNWEIDQWIFSSDLKGELNWARHGLVVESSGGRVLSTQDFNPDKNEQMRQWTFEITKVKDKLLP